MSKRMGVFDAEQLNALQNLFDQTWVLVSSNPDAASITDWAGLRTTLAQKVFEYSQTSLTDDEIIRAVLTSLGLL